MSKTDYGAKTIAKALAAEGVEAMFGVIGSIDLVLEEGRKLGIEHFVTRHEQAGGFAADGYARTLRRPGVVFASNGPGATNAACAMYHAKGANSPVVMLAGSQALIEDRMGANQEGYPAEILAGACKWTHRVVEPSTASHWVRKAFHDVMQPNQGPVTLDFPANILSQRDMPRQLKYIADQPPRLAPQTAGDPAEVRRAVELLAQAERPVILAADGIYWSDAMADLRAFAELMRIPVCTRRTARGAVPENHPLAFTAAYRRGFIADADLVCLFGQTVTTLDEWFEPPDWNPAAKWIQVQDVAENHWHGLPTEVGITGSSKLVLRQMLEYAANMDEDASIRREAWIARLGEVRRQIASHRAKVASRYASAPVLHPMILCEELASFVDDDATLIYDSFTLSSFITGAVQARRAGQILDAGLFQTLGHSIGMAIGAQIARPGKQVVALIGDGGFGIAGMDMETMVRYGLPCIVVLYNNASWGGRAWGHEEYYPTRASGDLSRIRYDDMFRAVGCHTEYVTRAEEVRPALERAAASGKPALINVEGETDAVHPFRMRVNVLDTLSRNNFNDLPEDAKAEMRALPKDVLERIAKRYRDNLFGRDIDVDELEHMIHGGR